jgi:hypothetical protein
MSSEADVQLANTLRGIIAAIQEITAPIVVSAVRQARSPQEISDVVTKVCRAVDPVIDEHGLTVTVCATIMLLCGLLHIIVARALDPNADSASFTLIFPDPPTGDDTDDGGLVN